MWYIWEYLDRVTGRLTSNKQVNAARFFQVLLRFDSPLWYLFSQTKINDIVQSSRVVQWLFNKSTHTRLLWRRHCWGCLLIQAPALSIGTWRRTVTLRPESSWGDPTERRRNRKEVGKEERMNGRGKAGQRGSWCQLHKGSGNKRRDTVVNFVCELRQMLTLRAEVSPVSLSVLSAETSPVLE